MTSSAAQSERERLETELARLLAKRRAFEEALSEFLHEGRRTGDALERAGGRSRDLEAKARALTKNVEMTRRDLRETAREIEALQQRLARLGAETP